MSTSKIGAVVSWFNDFVDWFDFKRPGVDGSLGKAVTMKAVDRIIALLSNDQAGVSGIWLANEPKYAAWKEKNCGVAKAPNVRTRQMLSQKSLYGRTKIESKEITMIYGTGDPPDRALAETPTEKQLKADKKVTDVQKAYFAHTGQSKHKIKRPFYELDESDGVAIA
jgi:hypothetical protein